MGDVLDSSNDEIEIVKEEEEIQDIQVHNLDVINRQAPSGNYDEDLIELDNIKDEIAEIKNNLSQIETEEKETAIPEVQKEEIEKLKGKSE